MTFQEALAQAIVWLLREQRLSYRALKLGGAGPIPVLGPVRIYEILRKRGRG